jgi:hypothetical protein
MRIQITPDEHAALKRLEALNVTAVRGNFDADVLRSLVSQGLVEEWSSGQFRMTTKGLAASQGATRWPER